MTASSILAGPAGLRRDLAPPLTPLQAMAESGRCLYCFEAACVRACPTSIDIPGFIRAISTGNLLGAAVTILDSNIMGGTCARACPTEVLCEQACIRNAAESAPVAIGRLQRHATDALLEAGVQPFARAPDTGRRVAVVGAGPAGLSCAHRLARLGHAVTVFEARAKAGGLNEYGLAAYKMAGDVAAREVAFILGVGGIAVEHGVALGRDVTLDDLRGRFDAVFLGVGLGASNALHCPGEELDGVVDALDFIAAIRQGLHDGPALVGKRVLVIGGGNTAVDAAVQARLLGAEEVTLAYRRGRGQMGATGFEQGLAQASGVVLRTWLAPRRVLGDGGTAVAAVEFERTRLTDDGRLVGTEQTVTLDADLVLKAVGQALKPDGLAGLTVERGRVAVDADGCTGLPGVFAGGDCVTSGPDLTVQAVADGTRAARAIHQFLNA